MADAIAVAERYASSAGREVVAFAKDLESFAQLLAKWQRVQNLVSRETAELWDRHIADSLQLVKLVPPTATTWLDVGSGGGFPAIPLAIALHGRNLSFTLVEANQRKAAFLRAVARDLHLPLTVSGHRLETIAPRETSVVSARALAPLSELMELVAPWFGPATVGLFHKGREFGEELDKSRALWHFDVIVHESETATSAAILEIRNLKAIAGT